MPGSRAFIGKSMTLEESIVSPSDVTSFKLYVYMCYM